MDKTAIIGILTVALLISGSAACLTVDSPGPSADPTKDIGEMISAELTRVASLASNDVAPPITPLPASIDTLRPQPAELPQPLQPTVTLQHLHSGPTIAELVARLRPSLAHMI